MPVIPVLGLQHTFLAIVLDVFNLSTQETEVEAEAEAEADKSVSLGPIWSAQQVPGWP